MSTRDLLAEAVCRALSVVTARDGLAVDVAPEAVHLERPARREHGDWSTNVALVVAKRAGVEQRDLASSLVAELEASLPPHVTSVEIAGPGFVNFRLDDGWLYDSLADLLAAGEDGYAMPDVGQGSGCRWSSSPPTPPVPSMWATAGGEATAMRWRGSWPVPGTT